MRYAPLLLPFVVACSGAAPQSAEDCAGIGSAKKRDECYLAVLPTVFAKDAQAGVTMVETQISDPISRDFAWYQVTKTVDPHSNKYCDRIKDETLAARCRTLVSRPHLHRDLTGSGPAGSRPPPPGEGATPGAPPPGQGATPGAPPPGTPPAGTP